MKRVDLALREAGFDFAHNVLTQRLTCGRTIRLSKMGRSEFLWFDECNQESSKDDRAAPQTV